MVKKLMKFFGYFLFFLAALVAFVPKSSLYFVVEKQIEPLGVVISQEALVEHFFSLEIEHAHLNLKGVEAARVQHASVMLLGVYNRVQLQDIKLSAMAKSFLPLRVDEVDIIYSVVDPLHVRVKASGAFGHCEAVLNVKTRRFELVLHPSKLMKQQYSNALRELKKEKNGEYHYVQAL